MERPTPNSEAPYSKQDVIRYLESAAPDDAEVHREATNKSDEVALVWSGLNRRDVFVHLLERGWAITSTDSQYVWLERIDGGK